MHIDTSTTKNTEMATKLANCNYKWDITVTVPDIYSTGRSSNHLNIHSSWNAWPPSGTITSKHPSENNSNNNNSINNLSFIICRRMVR